jgi:hypothetical protein
MLQVKCDNDEDRYFRCASATSMQETDGWFETMDRLASMVEACAGRRTTLEKVIKGKTWFDAEELA